MRRIAIPVAASLLAATFAGPVLAQDKPVELRFSHWVPPSHPMHPAVEAWAESIKKASNGTITMKIYPAQQLGKAFDHYNMAKDGIADFAHVNPGYEPGRFPIMGLSEIPFIFANSKQGSAALDAWYRKYADKEMKDVKYCITFAHDPATFHTTNKKVTGARRREGHEDPSGQCDDQPFHLAARRHQCAGVGTGIARPSGEGRGRRHHLPLGIDRAVRDRQGDEISPRRAALRHRADLRDEQGQVQFACRRRSAR